jgi:hypothetical protein
VVFHRSQSPQKKYIYGRFNNDIFYQQKKKVSITQFNDKRYKFAAKKVAWQKKTFRIYLLMCTENHPLHPGVPGSSMQNANNMSEPTRNSLFSNKSKIDAFRSIIKEIY